MYYNVCKYCQLWQSYFYRLELLNNLSLVYLQYFDKIIKWENLYAKYMLDYLVKPWNDFIEIKKKYCKVRNHVSIIWPRIWISSNLKCFLTRGLSCKYEKFLNLLFFINIYTDYWRYLKNCCKNCTSYWIKNSVHIIHVLYYWNISTIFHKFAIRTKNEIIFENLCSNFKQNHVNHSNKILILCIFMDLPESNKCKGPICM